MTRNAYLYSLLSSVVNYDQLRMDTMKTLLTNDDRFLRMPEVRSITALSRAHIYLLISKDEFPKQYKLGERAAGWLESEVLAWMQSKITPTGSDHRSEAS